MIVQCEYCTFCDILTMPLKLYHCFCNKCWFLSNFILFLIFWWSAVQQFCQILNLMSKQKLKIYFQSFYNFSCSAGMKVNSIWSIDLWVPLGAGTSPYPHTIKSNHSCKMIWDYEKGKCKPVWWLRRKRHKSYEEEQIIEIWAELNKNVWLDPVFQVFENQCISMDLQYCFQNKTPQSQQMYLHRQTQGRQSHQAFVKDLKIILIVLISQFLHFFDWINFFALLLGRRSTRDNF